MTTQSWQSFVEFAAYVRGNPRFEIEERDRNLEAAHEVRSFLQAALEGLPLQPRLAALLPSLCNTGRPYDLTHSPMNAWLERWALADEAGLRRGLTCFLEADKPAPARFARFARAAEEAEAAERVEPRPREVLTWGAVFNFATSPAALPVVQAPQFERLERRLGFGLTGDSSITKLYEEHVDFARWLEAALIGAGVPIEDMIDVQGLILLFSDDTVVPPARANADAADSRGTVARPRHALRDRPYLSACSCLGYETPYLLEWVEFHRLVGVERFFLYNNGDRRIKPPGLVIENYTVSLNSRLDRLIKSIVDPARTERCLGPHSFAYLKGSAVDENRYPIGGGATTYISSSRLRVNHYLSKSEEEFRSKLASREAYTGAYRSFDIDDFAQPKFGFRDTAILEYLPSLRAALASSPARTEQA